MSKPVGLSAELAGFSGVAPLFPLPDFVLFPQVTQPLHVFEPRYRDLLADTLAGERLIAMGTLKPNWESLYDTKTAPVWPDLCLGRVMLERELEDGRSLIILRGICRARIRAEKLTKTPYRQVELDLKIDEYPDTPEIARANRRAELLEGLITISPEAEAAREATESALRDLPLGVLADLIASSVKLPIETQVELIRETNVDLRTDLLLDVLRELRRTQADQAKARTFPPEFSQN